MVRLEKQKQHWILGVEDVVGMFNTHLFYILMTFILKIKCCHFNFEI